MAPKKTAAAAGVAIGAGVGAAVLSTGRSAFATATPEPQSGALAPPRRAAGAPAVQQLGSQAKATVPTASSTGTVLAGVAAGVTAVALKTQRGRAAHGRIVRSVATMEAPTKVAEKEDLSNALPDCPSTIWKADDIDIENIPQVEQSAPLVIDALELGDQLQPGAEAEYFAQNREVIMEQLQQYGAIWLRNFKSTKDAAGFRSMYEALKLNPCLDPIHTSGLREMVGKKDAVYEAVNKPSLAQHFVGLHNESTYVKTATFGAFVCFKPASEGGGEFIIADGAKIIQELNKDVLKRLYERKVRISVSNLDLNFLGLLPEGIKEGAKDYFQDLILKAVAPKFDMDLEMIYGADNSNPYRLQAIEHAQSPINRHPVTGQPVWFCNLHNHSRYLRDRRPCTVPEVGMTDVYHGDLSTISPDDVRHINEVCERNIVSMMMKEGDVVLLDNYRVLHGRKTFKGERSHAVTWFESCGEPLSREKKGDRPDDFMNNLINKTLV